jgi:phospholipid/cholesterol/gamma-HCH transport system permease protein
VYWIDSIGAGALGFVRYAYVLCAFFYLSLKMLWLGRHLGQRDFVREVFTQVYFTAVQAIAPVMVLALAVGALAIAEGMGGVGALSGAENLGKMVTVIVLREVAPLFTGVVVIARSVTAIAAELGMMRVQREIEALEVMGISPIRHLVTPRLFGGLLSLFGLSVLFATVALLGGFLAAQLLMSLPASVFFGAVLSATAPLDIAAFLAKILLGGIGLFLIACYHGMDVEGAPTEVPVAVSRAALNALVFLVAWNGLVSFAVLLSSPSASLLLGSFL